jgi:hypothetical protein
MKKLALLSLFMAFVGSVSTFAEDVVTEDICNTGTEVSEGAGSGSTNSSSTDDLRDGE